MELFLPVYVDDTNDGKGNSEYAEHVDTHAKTNRFGRPSVAAKILDVLSESSTSQQQNRDGKTEIVLEADQHK